MAKKKKSPVQVSTTGSNDDVLAQPRIIGGAFRGRKLLYSGDLRTRPMKDRVREAVFNLVGPAIAGKVAIDLFAGTGALGLEALSRGATSAILVERHFPTAALIRQNAETLGCIDRVTIHPANTLLWAKKRPALPDTPWVVFCSPPYDMFIDQYYELSMLIRSLLDEAPAGSIFVVEADTRFDFSLLPEPEAWDVREYPPAVVGIAKLKPAAVE